MNRTPIRTAIVLVCLVALVAPSGAELRSRDLPTVTARDVVTSIELNESLLVDLGMRVEALQTSAPSLVHHKVSVMDPQAPAFAGGEPWSLKVALREDGQFAGFRQGRIKHRGGFELHWDGGRTSLHGFELRPGKALGTFMVHDAQGNALFWSDLPHHDLDPSDRRLHVFNADLRITPEFAARLDHPEIDGLPVGGIALTATLDIPEELLTTLAQKGICPDNWATAQNGLEQDVALINIGSVTQLARSGGQVVIAPSATLKNVGTADVPWYTQFSGNFPPYDNDQHPLLTWSLFKVKDGIMRQLAVSDVKHAFLTINTNCTGCGADSNILGLACEDVYSQFSNRDNTYLAPRNEIDATKGIWRHCDTPAPNTVSHFDTDGNCNQDHFGSGDNDFTHGLVVDESELGDPEAEYIFQSWYLVRDDVNIFNTMGRVRLTPTFTSLWTFPFAEPFRQGSPLNLWVNPANPGAGEMNETLTNPTTGSLQLAVKTTDSGAPGITIFDYVLMNHDDSRNIESFTIPFPGAVLSGTSFFDSDSDTGNDWVPSISSGSVTFTAPTADDALAWGRAVSFRLILLGDVTTVEANLGPLGAGGNATEIIPTLSATREIDVFNDDFELGNTSLWSATVP